jgi:hypothetical protein
MSSVDLPLLKRRWYLIPVRVLLVTAVVTLLSFAISLFLGIVGTVLAAALRGAHVNMAMAYRRVALPVALIVAAAVLLATVVMEIRDYRRARTLDRMEGQLAS